ncbi:ParB N-terminal domain-containing protein (plasmid) [Bacillus cereus]|uniref:ParB N-terminal domain-containing protein n=1 Tax=Bacillus cereus TaxID=1396 RepID=UPI003DA83D83
MGNIISSLDLLHPNQIYFHESYESKRLEKICRVIENEGVLRNPPLVSELKDGSYLLLDGAHRMMAMIELGCKRIAVQVVPDEKVQLHAWNHILPTGEWLDSLKKNPMIIWADKPLENKRLLVKVTEANGQEYFLYPNDLSNNLFPHLDAWHSIVNLYQHDYNVCRHANDSTVCPSSGEVLMSYPEYSLVELRKVVEAKLLMPAGVTRTKISGRLLNLRIPLHVLRTETYPAAEWESLCDDWSKYLRHYNEPIYVYDA